MWQPWRIMTLLSGVAGRGLNRNSDVPGFLLVLVTPQTKMPPCPSHTWSTIYHPDSSHPVLTLSLPDCLIMCEKRTRCLSVNVNLRVVKGCFVSRREECGQTSDGRSANGDFDQSPQSGFCYLNHNPIPLFSDTAVLDYLSIYKVDSYTHLIIKLFIE